jgi:protein SCO1/2
MTRTIRDLSPQFGVYAAALMAVLTLSVDLYDARPVIARWMQSDSASPQVLSIDALSIPLETSNGEHLLLAATGGRVRIATMFYAHCPTMCPLAVQAIQSIDRDLTPAERGKLRVLLLSLDPARDAPSVLSEFASERGIDSKRWTLARTAREDVGRMAHALRVSYGDSAAGIVDHTPVLVLLDASGRELARTDKLGAADPAFVAAVRRALDTGSRS